MAGAAALDPAIYEEVEADETATTQAFAFEIGVRLMPEAQTRSS
jgi:hypothetical protein